MSWQQRIARWAIDRVMRIERRVRLRWLREIDD